MASRHASLKSHHPTICLCCSKKSQQSACWWQIQWIWTNKPQKSSLPLRTVCCCSSRGKSTLLCARNALEKALLLRDAVQLFSSIFGKLPTAFQIPREESLKKPTLQIQQWFCRNDHQAVYLAGSAVYGKAGAVQEITLL